MTRPLRIVPTILGAALLAASVQACDEPISAPASDRATAHRFDGETLFRGLVMMEGPVLGQFPELSTVPTDMPGASAKQAEQARAWVIAEIRKADPAFFPRFAAAMQSGDHLRVQQGLAETRGLVQRIAEAHHGGPLTDLGNDAELVTLAVVANAVIAVNLVWAWNVMMESNVAWDSNWVYHDAVLNPLNRTPGSLHEDQMVQMIATRLAADPV